MLTFFTIPKFFMPTSIKKSMLSSNFKIFNYLFNSLMSPISLSSYLRSSLLLHSFIASGAYCYYWIVVVNFEHLGYEFCYFYLAAQTLESCTL